MKTVSLSRHLLITLLSIAFLVPAPAFAFDQAGTMAATMLFLSLSAFTVMNLVLMILFFFTGQYQRTGFAKRHVLASLIPSVIALLLVSINYHSASGTLLNIGIIFIASAFALIPFQLQQYEKKATSSSAFILGSAALILLLPAYIIAPLVIFPLALAHVAYTKQANIKAKVLSGIVFISGYPLLVYWLYETLIQLKG